MLPFLLQTSLILGLAGTIPAPSPMVSLENGMRVLLAPDPHATAVDVAIWYEAGPLFEPSGKSGITHVVERAMLQPAAPDSAGFRALLTLEGATVSSVTTPDFTGVFATGPAEIMELALRRIAALHRATRMDSAIVKQERERTLAERAARLDGSLAARTIESLFALVFEGHGYARPVLGTASETASLTFAEVRRYRAERYASSSATLSVVGRFDPVTTLATIRREFGVARNAKPVVRTNRAATAPPEQSERRRGVEKGPPGNPAVAIGWRAPAASDPDRAALELLSRIVGEGSGSRLDRLQRTEEWPIGLSRVFFDPRRAASVMYVVAVPRPGADLETCEQALVAEFEKLATQPVTAEELERARRAVERDALLEQTTVRSRALALATRLFESGSARIPPPWQGAAATVTPETLRRAAARLFTAERRSVVWVEATAAEGEDVR